MKVINNLIFEYCTHVQMNLPLVLPVVLSTLPVKDRLSFYCWNQIDQLQQAGTSVECFPIDDYSTSRGAVGFGWDNPACHMAGIAGQLRIFGPWASV